MHILIHLIIPDLFLLPEDNLFLELYLKVGNPLVDLIDIPDILLYPAITHPHTRQHQRQIRLINLFVNLNQLIFLVLHLLLGILNHALILLHLFFFCRTVWKLHDRHDFLHQLLFECSETL